MRIAITGARGFIGCNLQIRLRERGHTAHELIPHDIQPDELIVLLKGVDFVFHLAGVNRPKEPSEFEQGNHSFTRMLCDTMAGLTHKPRVVYASSIQAAHANPYGQSKRRAEEALLAYGHDNGVKVHVFRLTNVFGKWSRPNYNSAVATFCHNIARDLPITVNDPTTRLRLIYIDDVLTHFCALLEDASAPSGLCVAGPEYEATVGEVASQIQAFRDSRNSLVSERVGVGLVRALYSTYVSFLPTDAFDYPVARHEDPRGVFVEMLKTPDCGQFSYFTAHPGITRGEHYHHTKTEKFLVIKGTAHFGFRHMISNETYEIVTRGGEARIVETIPGWTHNITNIGDDELIVMLWANEIFDRQKPDTIAQKVMPV